MVFTCCQLNGWQLFLCAVGKGLVEAAGIALPYGIENKQVTDFEFRSGRRNRQNRCLSLRKTYVALSRSPERLMTTDPFSVIAALSTTPFDFSARSHTQDSDPESLSAILPGET